MIELDRIKGRLNAIEQEAAEKTKAEIKRLLSRIVDSYGFPKELNGGKDNRGFLLWATPIEGIFVRSKGIFTAQYSHLTTYPESLPIPDWKSMREASAQTYQKYAPILISNLEYRLGLEDANRERIKQNPQAYAPWVSSSF